MNGFTENQVLAILNRIADALEKGSEDQHSFTPEQMERMIVVQELNARVAEERLEVEKMHNEMHMRGTAHGEQN